MTEPEVTEAETAPRRDDGGSIEEAVAKTRLIAEAALDLKGEAIVALDMHLLSSFADCFLLVSGRSDRHVRSVADAILRALREAGDEPLGVEGLEDGHWVLIDANDVVVHVFDPETRDEYDLERLWSDAPRLDLGLPGIEDEAPDALA